MTLIERWTELIIGAIILISPWVLGFSDITLARWANMIFGLALVLINVWAIYGNPATSDKSLSSSKITIKKLKNNKSRVTV